MCPYVCCSLPPKRQHFVVFSWKTGSVEVRFPVADHSYYTGDYFCLVLVSPFYTSSDWVSSLQNIFAVIILFSSEKIIVVRWSYKDPTECCPHAAAVFHHQRLLRQATGLWATLGFSLERNWSSNRVKSENQLFKAMKCFCYANNWKTCMTQECSL